MAKLCSASSALDTWPWISLSASAEDSASKQSILWRNKRFSVLSLCKVANKKNYMRKILFFSTKGDFPKIK